MKCFIRESVNLLDKLLYATKNTSSLLLVSKEQQLYPTASD